jgi:sugar diacid utilization regulator
MFHYKKLEKILSLSLSIAKHGQLIYSSIENCPFEYDQASYRICTSRALEDEELSLVNLIIEKNEQKQPFWLRVLKDLPYDENEIPVHFKGLEYYQTWLIKAKAISESVELIRALFEYSEVIIISTDKLLIIFNANELIQPKDLCSHLESEVMVSPFVYVGPKVKQLNDLKESFDQTQLLTQLRNIEQNLIVEFGQVLYQRVLYDLPDESKVLLLKNYLALYPIHNLTDDLIETIYGFFSHNLNITDTASALYLHRNTLVYRLNKINQVTNLDVRLFEDANKMKILLSLI